MKNLIFIALVLSIYLLIINGQGTPNPSLSPTKVTPSKEILAKDEALEELNKDSKDILKDAAQIEQNDKDIKNDEKNEKDDLSSDLGEGHNDEPQVISLPGVKEGDLLPNVHLLNLGPVVESPHYGHQSDFGMVRGAPLRGFHRLSNLFHNLLDNNDVSERFEDGLFPTIRKVDVKIIPLHTSIAIRKDLDNIGGKAHDMFDIMKKHWGETLTELKSAANEPIKENRPIKALPGKDIPEIQPKIHACVKDVKKYCLNTKSLVDTFSCLSKNSDKISKKCLDKVSDKPVYACAEDIKNTCSTEKRGRKAVKKCLKKNFNSLSKKCSTLIETKEERHKHLSQTQKSPQRIADEKRHLTNSKIIPAIIIGLCAVAFMTIIAVFVKKSRSAKDESREGITRVINYNQIV